MIYANYEWLKSNENKDPEVHVREMKRVLGIFTSSWGAPYFRG